MAVITFSREPHSGTRDLARLLADRLGYRYVSRDEVTRLVRARSGVERTPQTAEGEGRAPSFLEQLGEQLTGEGDAYRSALKAVVTELATADDVVIVGHGAGLFLPDLRTVIRVFVVAPMRERVERVVAEGEPDPERARRQVEQEDKESAAYLQYLFGIDWRDPHRWDLVINSGRANLDAVMDMLAHYAESVIRNEAEQSAVAELGLASRVEQALLADEDLGVSGLRVRADGGALVLEGEALTQDDRDRAEAMARAEAGGAALDNRIVVHPPTSA